MNKIKKVFMSSGVFITGLLTKIPVTLAAATKYGIEMGPDTINESTNYDVYATKYGVYEPTIGQRISRYREFYNSYYIICYRIICYI